MALYKKEVLVRPNSSADFETAMNWTKNWLQNTFQDAETNKDENGEYIDYFFADVFFAYGHSTNSGQTWRIFSAPCEQKYGMAPASTGRIEFLMNDKEGTDSAIEALQEKEVEQESRIDALENSSADVEATVI